LPFLPPIDFVTFAECSRKLLNYAKIIRLRLSFTPYPAVGDHDIFSDPPHRPIVRLPDLDASIHSSRSVVKVSSLPFPQFK